MKEITASKRFFCSKECLDHKGCNSFAYLTTATTGNCQLSTSVDGVSVGGDVAAEIYKKVPTEPKVSAIIAVIVVVIVIVMVMTMTVTVTVTVTVIVIVILVVILVVTMTITMTMMMTMTMM